MAARKRKKPIPTTETSDLTGPELAALIRKASSDAVQLSDHDAADSAAAINAGAYVGVASHLLRKKQKQIFDAANTLLDHLSVSYPMEYQLAELHNKLEAALPFLLPPGWQPRGEPYWTPAIIVHTQSCAFCLRSGLEAGMSRESVAVRITASILQRLGYSVTAGALESFFQKIRLGESLRPDLATLQNATKRIL